MKPRIYRNHRLYFADNGKRSMTGEATQYLLISNLLTLSEPSDPRRAEWRARVESFEHSFQSSMEQTSAAGAA